MSNASTILKLCYSFIIIFPLIVLEVIAEHIRWCCNLYSLPFTNALLGKDLWSMGSSASVVLTKIHIFINPFSKSLLKAASVCWDRMYPNFKITQNQCEKLGFLNIQIELEEVKTFEPSSPQTYLRQQCCNTFDRSNPA